MSTAIIKLQIPQKSADQMLPDSFNTDLLIVLIRELIKVMHGCLPDNELIELGQIMREYIRRVVETQGESALAYLNSNPDVLFHDLFDELHAYLNDELVSRLIGYRVRTNNLADCFMERLGCSEHGTGLALEKKKE